MQYLVLSGLVFKCKLSYIATFPLMSAQPMAGRQDADMLITCQAANLINTSGRKGVKWFCLHPPSKTTVYYFLQLYTRHLPRHVIAEYSRKVTVTPREFLSLSWCTDY